jgi:pimeloyl-ACP methyl ester carboxylesterase
MRVMVPLVLLTMLLLVPASTASAASTVVVPADVAAWSAQRFAGAPLPDPRHADPAAVAGFFAAAGPVESAYLARGFPRLVAGFDGAPLALRLAAGDGVRLLSDPHGDGRIAEVVGDPLTAERIVVLVPGVDTSAANFHRGLGGVQRRAPAWQARQVYDAAGPDVAVVAWLGYDPPEGLGVASARTGRARDGAAALVRFLDGLAVQRPSATFVLVGHSYGSAVLSLAAPALPPAVTDLVALGSPGMGVPNAASLRTTARVWAGRAPDDWTRFIPGVRVFGFGHGTKPTAPGFGARVLPCGDVDGHDGYFVPGTSSLAALAGIARDMR